MTLPLRFSVWVAIATSACATTGLPKPAVVRPGPSADAPRIVIVQSTTSGLFEAPVSSFMDQANAAITLYDRVGDHPEALVAAIRASNPSLIFTLGTRATMLVANEFHDIPVIFTMVVNHRRLGLEKHDNVMGIALEPSTTSEFSQFRMVIPRLQRVLAFYVSRESATLIDSARTELATLGIELVAVDVASPAAVETAYQGNRAGIDGVWFLNDPVLMNEQTFDFLRDRTRAEGVPLLASLSDKFAHKGAFMSVSTDLTALGSQAASMARMNLEQGRSPTELGVQPPISTKLVVNLDVAKRLGIEIAADALPFVGELIETKQVSERRSHRHAPRTQH